MLVCDIIENPNFDAEFEYVINLVNDDAEIAQTYDSNMNEIPYEVMVKQVIYMNIGSIFVNDRNSNFPCLVIEVHA